MSQNNQLVINISLDSADASSKLIMFEQFFKSLQGNAEKFNSTVKKGVEEIAKPLPEKTAFRKLGEHVVFVNQGLEAMITLYQSFSGIVKGAADLNNLRDNFQGTAEDVENFRKATAETISEAGLLKLSNQATDLGVSLDKQVLLFALAENAADKYGTTTEEGFIKLVTASEGSARGLKSLGIQKEIFEQIVARMAKAQGTTIDKMDAEAQKQIRLNAIIEASGITYESAISKVKDAADEIEGATAAFDDMITSLMQNILPAITKLGEFATSLFRWIRGLNGSIQILISTIASLSLAFLTLNSSFGATPYIIITTIGLIVSMVKAMRDGDFVGMLVSFGTAIGAVFLAAKFGLLGLQTAMLTSPIGLVIMGIVGGVGLLITAINSLASADKREAEASLEATNAEIDLAAQRTKTIDVSQKKIEQEQALITKYQQLYEKLQKVKAGTKEHSEIENELKTVLVELNKVHPGLITNTNNLGEAQKQLSGIYINNKDQASKYTQQLLELEQVQKRLANQKFWDEYRKEIETNALPGTEWFGVDSTLTNKIKDSVYTGTLDERVEKITKLADALQNNEYIEGVGKFINISEEAKRKIVSSLLTLKEKILTKNLQDTQTISSSGSSSNSSSDSDSDSKLKKEKDIVELTTKKYKTEIELHQLRKDGMSAYQSMLEYENQLQALLKNKQLTSEQEVTTLKEIASLQENIVTFEKAVGVGKYQKEKEARISDLIKQEKDLQTVIEDATVAEIDRKKAIEELIVVQKQLNNELSQRRVKTPKSMDTVEVPSAKLYSEEMDALIEKHGVLAIKTSSFIQNATGGLLGLVDVYNSVRQAGVNAGNAVASAFGESAKPFKQANSLLEIFINNLISSVAQALAFQAIMVALGMGGNSDTGKGSEGSVLSAIPVIGPILGLLGFAKGGKVEGPGSGTSDSIPAMLSNGEFVINAESTKKWFPFLETINRGFTPPQLPAFAMGGYVGKAVSSSPVIVQPIINVSGSMEMDMRKLRTNINAVGVVDKRMR